MSELKEVEATDGDPNHQSDFKSVLRNFMVKSTSISQTEQRALYHVLIYAIRHETEIPPAIIKGLLKTILQISFFRYDHKRSQKHIKAVIDECFSKDLESAISGITNGIESCCKLKGALITRSTSVHAALCADFLVSALVKLELISKNRNLVKDVHSALGAICFYAGATKTGINILRKGLKSYPKTKLPLFIEDICSFANEEKGFLKVVPLIMAFMEHVSLEPSHEDVLVQIFTDVYIKGFLLAKEVTSNHVLDGGKFYKHIAASLVIQEIIPNTKKALLRSPEVAIFGVERFLKNFLSDTSPIVMEYFSLLYPLLTSTNDVIRENAILSLNHLSTKIKDVNVWEAIVKRVVESISAKNVNALQRQPLMSMLKSLGSDEFLANNTHNKTALSLIEFIGDRLSAPILAETNEKITRDLWSVLVTWLSHSSTLPANFLNLFRKVTIINASGNIRFIALLSISLIYDNFEQKIDVDDEISKNARKLCSVKKDATNINEFLAAAYLVCRSFFDKKFKIEKDVYDLLRSDSFLKDRLFSSLDEQGALVIPLLAKKALLNELKPHSDYPSGLIRLFTVSLFWPSFEVRRASIDVVKFLSSNEPISFLQTLLETILEGFQSGFLDQIVKKLTEWQNPPKDLVEYDGVPGWNVSYVLAAILSDLRLDESSTSMNFIAIALLIGSLPRVVKHDGGIWLRWISSKPQLHSIIRSTEFSDLFCDRLLTWLDIEGRSNAIKLIVSLGNLGRTISDEIWSRCTEIVHTIDIKKYVQVDSKDVAIFYTPDGTLFNTNVIDENSDYAIEAKNLKRESKAYKYKDQLAEIQLRKELAEKNKKEGKLTERQKKAVEAELRKESEIRKELTRLYKEVDEKLDVLSTAARFNPSGAFNHIRLLYDVVVPLLQSPLAAKPAFSTYMAFRDAFFEPSENHLHEIVLHASVRFLESKYLMEQWCASPLEQQLDRLFSLLSSLCIMGEVGIGEDVHLEENLDFDDDLLVDTITSQKIAFLVPLFEKIFTSTNCDNRIKLTTLSFLTRSITDIFIKPEEVISEPVLKMNLILLSLVSKKAYDLTDEIMIILKNYTRMLDRSELFTDSVKDFVESVLTNLKEPDPIVRRNILDLLEHMPCLLSKIMATDLEFKEKLTKTLYLMIHDDDNNCAEMAELQFGTLKLKTSTDMCLTINDAISSTEEFIRHSSGKALLDLIHKYPYKLEEVLDGLFKLYGELYGVIPAKFDDVGRKVKDEIDLYQSRSGVAYALFLISDVVPAKWSTEFVKRIVPDGLNDRNALCRDFLRNSTATVIRNHGKSQIHEMLPFLDRQLDQLPDKAEFDNLRQGIIVLLGTLARHLEAGNEKLRQIVAKLIESLSTPSQQVQESVADCLPALTPFIPEDAKQIISTLIGLLIGAESYGERRGAAYGIAGLMKGLGVSAFKEMNIITSIKDWMADKKNPKTREGALMVIELLCRFFGKLFEPYVAVVLPNLLTCFSDSASAVRTSASDTAKAIFLTLSSHGVKLILPLLLKALEDDSWRTKCAAVELLGSMSHCAPKQLSTCLPTVVPKLVEVLADSHASVQKAGENSLKQIAQVIRNPEIMAISSHLLSGLVDPASKTTSCLQTIVNTKFVHYVDAPSLALIIPIIKRAFSERNTESRKMAAQILSNIYSLTETKDMEPYLSDLLPGLKKALTDPSPEVRTVAAQALGSIIRCSSDQTSERLQTEILPWLKTNLVSRSSMVDRSGAAQGLSYVIAALGEDFLRANMPTVIKITESSATESFIRDGYILLYIYLPIVLGDTFLPYISQIIPSILKALADENEYVRDSALKAGQRLISSYTNHAKKLLLPQLQAAIIHENWRIRQAAVQLVGDYLFSISGVSGKMTSAVENEDDTMGMEAVNKAIVRHLGQKTRDEVLAAIYLARHDVALVVRQSASHVWKVVVANTPRTLRDIMKTLFEMLLHCLASSFNDRQQMAARCLGELVKKMGERILVDILPVLEVGLQTPSIEQRTGVAVALYEIMLNTHKDIISMYIENIVPCIRKCLADSSKTVRSSAAETFGVFYSNVGYIAMDEIIVPMLDEYNQNGDEDVMEGLCCIMEKNSRKLMPSLLPKLTKPPVNSTALCRLAAAAGDSLSRNLPKILDALLDNTQKDVRQHAEDCAPVILSVTDDESVVTVIESLIDRSLDGSVLSSMLLVKFTTETDIDLEDLADLFLPGTMLMYNSQVVEVVENGIAAMNEFVKKLNQAAILDLNTTLKRSVMELQKTAKGQSTIPGLTNPKGWTPLLAMLREGILSGGVDLKETSATALNILISFGDEQGLKPHAINLAGPLIRVLADRYNPPIKLAILSALSRLIEKVGNHLKAFLPQLQSTFLKAIQEPTSMQVRLEAGKAFARVIEIHPKQETIFLDLVKMVQTSEDEQLTECLLKTLCEIINRCGSKFTTEAIGQAKNVASLHKFNL